MQSSSLGFRASSLRTVCFRGIRATARGSSFGHFGCIRARFRRTFSRLEILALWRSSSCVPPAATVVSPVVSRQLEQSSPVSHFVHVKGTAQALQISQHVMSDVLASMKLIPLQTVSVHQQRSRIRTRRRLLNLERKGTTHVLILATETAPAPLRRRLIRTRPQILVSIRRAYLPQQQKLV